MLSAWLTLIPLLYLTLLAFLTWLVVWHSLQALETLSHGPFFVFHVPMACLGALLLLFLITPVFLRRKVKDPPILTLREEDEPLLFAFVTKLCALTGSRAPTLIEVDCEPNAAARFSGGFASLFGGNLYRPIMFAVLVLLVTASATFAAEPATRPATVRVAAVQCSSDMGDVAGNRKKLSALVEDAAGHGAKLVVLPEAAVTGYLSQDLKTNWQLAGRPIDATFQGKDPLPFAETVPGP